MKPVAVIILNWNGEKLLRRYLRSVAVNTNPDIAEIIVADNGSTDGSLAFIRDNFPQVKVMAFDTNHGFAGGYNLALAQTANEFTVLLNSDVETPPGWIEPLYQTMRENPETGACQPKILSLTDKSKFEYAGASGGFIDRNGYPYCRGRLFSSVETDNGQYDTAIPVFWATGAALMVRTALYNRLGGLDARFFAHMEEIDLCWRIHLSGSKIVVDPRSHVYHLGGGSLPASDPRKTYLNFRNNLLLLHKNLPVADVRPTLLRRRLLDTVAWLKFMLTFDFANANAILRAHRDFRSMRAHYTTHPDTNLLRDMPINRRNILIDYYIRGRRRFSDL
ncbi:MAG: glycosyltransferase family 2 protein [Muribaculaceae bacterium]|nr:glycosyltransferase family 2 protein [Muribaculaceae bacterium]